MILVFPDKTTIEGNPNVRIVAANQELHCIVCDRRVKIHLPIDASRLASLISIFSKEHKHEGGNK
jgi:hypothetical protein